MGAQKLIGNFEIRDHQVRLLYPIETGFEPGFDKIKLAEVSELIGGNEGAGDFILTSDVLAKIDASPDELVWEIEKPRFSRALHPEVRTLLAGDDANRCVVYRLRPNFRSVGNALHALVYGSDNQNLTVRMSATASNRLTRAGHQDVSRLSCELRSMRIFKFRSGVSVADVDLKLSEDKVSGAVLEEFLHAISHSGRMFCADTPDGSGRDFALTGLIQALLLTDQAQAARPRSFTVSCAIVPEGSEDDEVDGLTVNLAKHYTSDYRLDDLEHVNVQFRRPFMGTRRAVAAEGAAIVRKLDGTSFSADYCNGSFAPSYVPLTIMAIHEQAAWAMLTRQASQWPELDPPNQVQIEDLKTIHKRALQLRTAYGSMRVSGIADHDDWFEALSASMRIPQMKHAMTEDLAATEAVLRFEAERRVFQRYRWVTVAAGAAAAGVSLFTIVAQLFAIASDDWVWRWPDLSNFVAPTFVIPLLAFVAGAVVAGIALSKKWTAMFGRD